MAPSAVQLSITTPQPLVPYGSEPSLVSQPALASSKHLVYVGMGWDVRMGEEQHLHAASTCSPAHLGVRGVWVGPLRLNPGTLTLPTWALIHFSGCHHHCQVVQPRGMECPAHVFSFPVFSSPLALSILPLWGFVYLWSEATKQEVSEINDS